MLVLNFRIFHIYPYLTIMVEADSVGISSEPLILWMLESCRYRLVNILYGLPM